MSNFADLDQIIIHLAYKYRDEVKGQIIDLLRHYAGLRAQEGELIHDNGMSSLLCVLNGTIPITYNRATYNIPVDIFICEEFPREAPRLYVRPTADMIVNQTHSCVQPDGYLNIATMRFLQNLPTEWGPADSLLSFVARVCELFSTNPPLFNRKLPSISKPYQPVHEQQSRLTEVDQQRRRTSGSGAFGAATDTISPHAAQSGFTAFTFDGQGQGQWQGQGQGQGQAWNYAAPLTQANVAAATASTAFAPSSSQGGAKREIHFATQKPPATSGASGANSGTPKAGNSSSNSSSGGGGGGGGVGQGGFANSKSDSPFARPDALVAELTEKLKESIIIRTSDLENRLQVAFKDAFLLEKNANFLRKSKAKNEKVISSLEKAVADMRKKTADLKDKIDLKAKQEETDIEDRLRPFDRLSTQIIELSASKETLSECMLWMEKAIESGKKPITLHEYIKKTREISKEQFQKLAHLNKIAKCLQDHTP